MINIIIQLIKGLPVALEIIKVIDNFNKRKKQDEIIKEITEKKKEKLKDVSEKIDTFKIK